MQVVQLPPNNPASGIAHQHGQLIHPLSGKFSLTWVAAFNLGVVTGAS